MVLARHSGVELQKAGVVGVVEPWTDGSIGGEETRLQWAKLGIAHQKEDIFNKAGKVSVVSDVGAYPFVEKGKAGKKGGGRTGLLVGPRVKAQGVGNVNGVHG